MLFIFIISFLTNTFLYEDSVLAVVNNNKIYSSHYLARYNNFLQRVGVKDNLLIRKQILENMINENLILEDSKNQNWYSSVDFRSKINSKIDAHYITAFYTSAIETVTVTDAELKKTFIDMNTKIRARHLYAQSLEQAIEIRSRLINGEGFNRIANEVFTDKKLNSSGGDLGYFSIGEMEPAIEKAAYNLQIGEISNPIKTEDGYSILKVEDKIIKPLITETDFEKNKNKVYKYVKEQKQNNLTKTLAGNFAEELQITFNTKNLQLLFNEWKNIASNENYKIERQNSLQKIKNENLVKYSNGELSLFEFYSLIQTTTARQKNRVRTLEDLKEFVKGVLIRNEIIARSKKYKLDYSTEIKLKAEADTSILILNYWKDEVIAKNYSIDPISFTSKNKKEELLFNTNIKKYYEANKQNYFYKEEVNIAEIFVTDLNYALQIFDSLKQGKNFYELAKKYSERNLSDLQNYELGFGDRESYGIYADTLFSLKLNDFIGPVPLSHGYSIFKLVGKKKSKQKSFLEARNEIANQLYREESNKIFFNVLDSLREKSSITTNISLVEKLILQ